MKRKVYVAKRIPKNSPLEEVLPVNMSMSVQEVMDLYVKHYVEMDTYIYNGHWTLRGNTPINNIPEGIQPVDVWLMCKSKIDESDVFIGVVGLDTYGAIAEAAYAIGLNTKPVYVLPENNSEELLKETWFIFASSLSTKAFWNEEDIQNIPLFSEHGIVDLRSYEAFIKSLVPPFLRR